MSIESQFCAFLQQIPAVAAAGAAAKVFPVFAPESAAAPYLVYRRLKTDRMQGTTGPVNPAGPVFRVTAWAQTYEQAVSLAAAIRAAVGVPRSAIPIAGVQLMRAVDEADAFEPVPELIERQFFGRQVDVLVKHNE